MTKHNEAAGEHLTKAHRKIGIKAVAAAVEVNKQKGGSDEAQTDSQGEASMNEQPRRFAERTTKAAHENFERGTSLTEDAARNAEQSYSTSPADLSKQIQTIDGTSGQSPGSQSNPEIDHGRKSS